MSDPHVHDLVITDTTVIPGDGTEPIPHATVVVDNGIVVAVTSGQSATPVVARREINGSHSAVLPGFVDSHTHIASNMLLRGLLDDLVGVEQFTWLDKMWLMKENFDHDTLYWASMCGLVEMAKSGITCFNEHFDGYAVTPQVRALEQLKLRATLGYGFADGGTDRVNGLYAGMGPWSWAAVEDMNTALAGARGIDGDRVRLALSPHAPYSTSPELWQAVRACATDLGLPIHTHVAEGRRETEYMDRTHGGRTTIEWLDELGILGPDVTAAHCTMVSPTDMGVMAARGVKVAHCAISNAKGCSGTMDLRALWAAGVQVGIATDGPAGHNTLDMFQEMKFATITQKQLTGDPTFMTMRETLGLATHGSAQVMHRAELGTVTVGSPADLTVVNLDVAHVAPLYNVEAALVYSSRADDVTHTIVGGELIVDNGEVVGVDEEEVVAKFTEHAHALRSRTF
ncbi:amidohydrolase family protein [Williamsia sp.]|uniref:amidohydrolase family protein n=1 Tax=Williamsia sp. TaxID=1872085 RepID=UPI002F9571E5